MTESGDGLTARVSNSDGDGAISFGSEDRTAALAALERDVLAHLAEGTTQTALERLARGLERLAAPGTLVSILVTDERDDRFLFPGSAPSLPEGYVTKLGAVPIGDSYGSCGTAAALRTPVLTADIPHDPRWQGFQQLAREYGLHACWSVPVVATDGALLGTFAFYFREPRAPSSADIAAMDESARLARIVLESQRTERLRVRSSRRKRALFAAASVIADAEDVDHERVLEGVIGALAGALDWDAAAVWLESKIDGPLSCAAVWSRDDRAFGSFLEATRARPLARGEGLPGRVVQSGEPSWITITEHATKHDEFPRHAPALSAGLSEGFAVPIIEHGRAIGAMELFTSRHEPADTDLLLALRTVGLQIGQFLRRARLVDELRETVRFSELFSGILAHDLRNPLNALVMGTEILAKSASDDRSRRMIDRMRSAETRMTRMIEQLLDLTRSRSGDGIAIAPVPVGLADIAGAAVSELRIAYPDRRIDLAAIGDMRGEWDHDRLAQVFSNLLGNALVHGEADGLVAIRLDGSAASSLRVETHNAGAIPAEHLPFLFDPFRRAAKTNGPARGLGLGLYITKLVVEAHGGSVDVSSSVEEGTRFGVTLPRTAKVSSSIGASSA